MFLLHWPEIAKLIASPLLKSISLKGKFASDVISKAFNIKICEVCRRLHLRRSTAAHSRLKPARVMEMSVTPLVYQCVILIC